MSLRMEVAVAAEALKVAADRLDDAARALMRAGSEAKEVYPPVERNAFAGVQARDDLSEVPSSWWLDTATGHGKTAAGVRAAANGLTRSMGGTDA